MTPHTPRRPLLSRARALRRWLRRPRTGQTLVIFALASTLLIGVLGLVLDAGYDYAWRRQMQNTADAAALAGANALLGNNSNGFTVWDTVKTVAQQNGVQTSQITECVYLSNEGTVLSDPPSCNDTPFAAGADVSAVRVTVRESHATFVMRLLGIGTSGSGATATAQIQLVLSIPNSQIPFLPCGVATKLVDSNGNLAQNAGPNGDGTMSILKTQSGWTDNYSAGNANQPTYTESLQDASGKVIIDPNAYSYGYGGNGLPSYMPSASNTPGGNSAYPNQYAFLIHKGSGNDNNGITRCSADGYSAWKGYNGLLTGQVNIAGTLTLQGSHNYGNDNPAWPGAFGPQSNSGNYGTGQGGLTQAGTGNRSGPASQVPGNGGCQAGQETNCILILPILDNSVGSGNGSNGILAARTFAAFYMKGTDNGDTNWGYLIANYPMTAQGTPIWTPGTVGTPTIHLIK